MGIFTYTKIQLKEFSFLKKEANKSLFELVYGINPNKNKFFIGCLKFPTAFY